MGTLTLAELKEEIRAGLRNRTDLDLRLTRFLNLAQQRIARLRDFDEMEVISTSTLPYTSSLRDKYISFPDLREIYSFKVHDGVRAFRLKQVPQRMWNRIVPPQQENQRTRFPTHYTLWQKSAIIYPLVDRAGVPVEVWHTVWPTPFSDGDLTARSQYEQKDEILIKLSLVYANNSLGKLEEAQKHWKDAVTLLMESVGTDQEKPDLDIDPAPGDQSLSEGLPSEYWKDPFLKEAP